MMQISKRVLFSLFVLGTIYSIEQKQVFAEENTQPVEVKKIETKTETKTQDKPAEVQMHSSHTIHTSTFSVGIGTGQTVHEECNQSNECDDSQSSKNYQKYQSSNMPTLVLHNNAGLGGQYASYRGDTGGGMLFHHYTQTQSAERELIPSITALNSLIISPIFKTIPGQYSHNFSKLEIGHGFGIASQSRGGVNFIGLGKNDHFMPYLAGSIADIQFSFNTKNAREDYLGWRMKVSGGAQFAVKKCKGRLGPDIGLNSGNLGDAGWFRPELGVEVEVTCDKGFAFSTRIARTNINGLSQEQKHDMIDLTVAIPLNNKWTMNLRGESIVTYDASKSVPSVFEASKAIVGESDKARRVEGTAIVTFGTNFH